MEKKNMFSKLAALYKESLIIRLITIFILLAIAFILGRTTTPAMVKYEPLQTNSPFILSQQTINKTFQFPITDDTGQQITQVNYTIQNADIQDSIILKGQMANAIAGKTFLVVNLKISNPSDKTVQLNTRDYIRLSANGSSDLLAPDIHNDPVQIQPIATTFTRVGFSINQSDKSLVLHVGEIDGDKTTIKLKIK